MNVWRYYEEWIGNLRMSRATGTVPERVQSRVHTTEPTGPVPEPFHCDHIARWSARSGTTGRSGTGVNTGARLRSGTVPVPKLWCEHGLSLSRSGMKYLVIVPKYRVPRYTFSSNCIYLRNCTCAYLGALLGYLKNQVLFRYLLLNIGSESSNTMQL